MHLTCAANSAYVPHSAAMLHSVLTDGDCSGAHVHYLHGDDMTRGQRDQLERMVVGLGSEVSFLRVGDKRLARLPTTRDLPTSHWYRVFLAELLPDVDRVLYLDADTVALDSLRPLWEVELADHCVAAVTNVFQADHFHLPAELGLSDPAKYFNTGVMVLDLASWRNDGLTDRIANWALSNSSKLAWPEQDVMNALLADRRLELHPRWNCMYSLRFPWAAYAFGYEALEEARRKPAVRHYEGPLMNKPWHFLCERELSAPYLAHRRQTPWPEVRREGVTPRNIVRRLRRAGPRGVARRVRQGLSA